MQSKVDAITALLIVARALEGQYSVVVLLQAITSDTYHLGVLSEYDISNSKVLLTDGIDLVKKNDQYGFTVGSTDGDDMIFVSQLLEVNGRYTVPRLGIDESRELYPLINTTVLNAIFDAPYEQCGQSPHDETSTQNNGTDI